VNEIEMPKLDQNANTEGRDGRLNSLPGGRWKKILSGEKYTRYPCCPQFE